MTDLRLDALRLLDLVDVEADALGGDGLLVDDRALLVQRHRLRLLAELDIAVDALVDGLTGHVNLFAGDGDVDLLLLGDDVLAQASLAGLATLLGDVEALLVKNDAVLVALKVALVTLDATLVVLFLAELVVGASLVDATLHTVLGVVVVVTGGVTGGSGRAGGSGVAAVEVTTVTVVRRATVRQAVVAVERLFLLDVEVLVSVLTRGVLDLGLRVGEVQVLTLHAGALERDEGLGGTEQARVDRDPGGLARLVVQVDLADRTDLVAVAVVGLAGSGGQNVVNGKHFRSPS